MYFRVNHELIILENSQTIHIYDVVILILIKKLLILGTYNLIYQNIHIVNT
jgi:hypothetical protein